jgi:hypothetical protein
VNQENQPGAANEDDQTLEFEAKTSELSSEELEQVNGGLIGLLLPAVDKIREAALTPVTPININQIMPKGQ